jgi:hypothetical protein
MGLVRMKLCILPIEGCRGDSGLDVYGGEARGLVRSGRLAALRVVDIGRWEFVPRFQWSRRPFLDLIVSRGVCLSILPRHLDHRLDCPPSLPCHLTL